MGSMVRMFFFCRCVKQMGYKKKEYLVVDGLIDLNRE
jgi:hypothetical protein